MRRLEEAGLRPGVQELADVLWLARHVSPAAGAVATAPVAEPGGPDERPAPEQPPTVPADPAPADIPDEDACGPPGPGSFRLDPVASEEESGLSSRRPVAAPAADVLPDAGSSQQALRALRRYQPSAHTVSESVIDEQASAERAAATGVFVPVLRERRRQAAHIQLAMDVSTSMAPWHELLRELRRMCERSGIFRSLSVHYLHEHPATGAPAVADSLVPELPALGPPDRLQDLAGRRITLVLSDCAGPLWRSGRMQRQLHQWAQTAPVAVLQPLPQRMWRRTHLPPAGGELRRQVGGGRWVFRPVHGPEPHPALRALAVPVLAPNAAALGSWARLLSGDLPWTDGAAAWVLPDHLASSSPRAGTAHDPLTLVRAFRTTASPDAVLLAGYLAAAPLTLPVMQLVQRVMLPHSGPSELAEVLLSGLLVRESQPSTAAYPPDGPAFAFRNGVRELLLQGVDQGAARLVLSAVSQYVERRFGRAARNFPALAAAYLTGTTEDTRTGEDDAAEAMPGHFAEVSQTVLRRYYPQRGIPAGPPAPEPASLRETEWFALHRRADRHLQRYDETGAVRDLEEAVRLLRTLIATGSDEWRGSWLYGLLSGALMRRWKAGGLVEDLVEAATTALHGDRLRGERPSVPGDFVTTGALGEALTTLARELTRPGGMLLQQLPELLLAELSPWSPGPLGAELAAYRLSARAANAYRTVADHPEQDEYARHQAARTQTHVLLGDLLVEGTRKAEGVRGPDVPREFAEPLNIELYAAHVGTATGLRVGDEQGDLAAGAGLSERARHHMGQGPLRGHVRPERGRAAAAQAVVLLRRGMDALAGTEDADPRVLVDLWTRRARLSSILATAPGDAPHHEDEELRAWSEAARHAERSDDPQLRRSCLRALGTACRRRFDQQGDIGYLTQALQAFAAAAQEPAPDPAEHDDLRTRQAEALVRYGRASAEVTALDIAVQALKGMRGPATGPDTGAERFLLLAEALLVRSMLTGSVENADEGVRLASGLLDDRTVPVAHREAAWRLLDLVRGRYGLGAVLRPDTEGPGPAN
ncbi:hypothetical protein HW130_30305 [Streptomyces sp. PKU-EA00015]|uniref:SAV_2336 N-terminal domain-related protein n=1 Tax=Streptomyces sp. PKU-EA00015 TaxID=2748326 RepID=UPI0015A3B349|nr:SAV_2336 N-terminal domain-related protein [Streptomyces sp. PKU-EA00015]NWF30497.1 hypothetical protein [Streptomyces sp. PKU-EA00015]